MGDIKPKPPQYFINLLERILEEKRKNQTNEKWFCQLSTEEKATFLAVNKLNFDYQMWLEWLKEEHNE